LIHIFIGELSLAKGEHHYIAWKFVWIFVIPISILSGIGIYYWESNVYYGIIFTAFILIGFFLGRWISPDWDQISTTSDEARMVKEIPVLGIVLYAFSSVYGAIFRSMHRSWITHFPGLSTILRLLFLFWWVIALYVIGIIEYQDWQWYLYMGVFCGLTISDLLHTFLDVLSSLFKNKKRSYKFPIDN
jgi:uncharacterized metal-binding protein